MIGTGAPTLLTLDLPETLRPEVAGAKAANLATMHRAGVRVPETLVIRRGCAWEDLQPDERARLEAAVRVWGGHTIVRTSALSEDGATRSLAGMYQSLHARPENLASVVAAVRAHADCIQRALLVPVDGGVAVLVQRFVAGAGGVYLTHDPAGCGSLLQMSSAGADAVTTGRSADLTPLPAGARGTALELCESVERHLGYAVDVEVAVEQGRAYLLQVRPQTGVQVRVTDGRGLTPTAFQPYFPFPLPRLAADLWADLFRSAWGAAVRVRDGRLLMPEGFEPEIPPSRLGSPDAAVAYWEGCLARRWRRSAVEFARWTNQIDGSWGEWTAARTRWHRFMRVYFHNDTYPWVEGARAKMEAGSDIDPTSRPTMRRLQVLERARAAVQNNAEAIQMVRDGRVRDLLTASGNVGAALRTYLARYGHVSEVPDDFSRPYPADEPELLTEVLLLDTPLPSHAGRPGSTIDPWARLVEIGEEDNDAKYRYSLGLRRAIQALGRHLAAAEQVEEPHVVWDLTLKELEALTTGRRKARRRVPAKMNEVKPVVLGSITGHWSGEPLSPGHATGVAWRPGTAKPAAESVVLVCNSLTPGLYAYLGGCRAVVCAVGGRASHGAIVAREFCLPAVRCPTAARTLQTGDSVRVDGWRGVVRR